MANISTLTVSLTADTAKFDNGLKKAKKTGKGFGKAMGAAFKGVGIAAAALGVGIAALTKQSLALVDQQRKSARTLNTTQGTYAGLALAAGIAGSSVEGFAKALKRQQKSIVDANDGLMTQKRAFDRLGLSTTDLLKLPVEEQFKKITSALGDVENSTVRVAAASDIFGAKNADLINILELGAEGIDFYINKVKELGVALTDNQTRAIEESNDAVLVMKTAFTGLGNQIAARVAPTIKAAAERVESLTARVTAAIPEWAAWAAEIFGVQRELDNFTLADFDAEVAVLNEQLFEQQRQLNNFLLARKNLLAGGVEPSDGLINRINAANDRLVALGQRFKEVTLARDALLARGEVLTPESGEGGITTPGTADTRASDLIEFRLKQVTKELEANFAMFDAWEARAKKAFDATRTPAEKLEQTIIDIRKQLVENPFFSADLAQREAGAAVDTYLEELKRLEAGTDDIFENMSEFQSEAFRNMQSIMADFLFDPFEDGLKGMLKSFVDMLRRMVAELIATKILETFFSAFGGATATTTTGSSGGGGFSGFGRAIGGRVAAGDSYLTGEGGPELFTPGASGSIRPVGSLSFAPSTTIEAGGGGLDWRHCCRFLRKIIAR